MGSCVIVSIIGFAIISEFLESWASKNAGTGFPGIVSG
jgi:hypothetical protein